MNSDGSRTLGGVTKPKFVPKAQPKKQIAEDTSLGPNEKPNEATSLKQVKQAHSVPDGGRDRHFQRQKQEQLKGGRGRGRWVLPTGAAFFTGGQSSGAIHKPARQSRIVAGTEVKVENGKKRQEEAIQKSLPRGEDVKPLVALMDESDSEDERGEPEVQEGEEVWPPSSYDPLHPLQLPFGPRTATARQQVAALPILADPNDSEAVRAEEITAAFLMQLPNDIRICPTDEERLATQGSALDVSDCEANAHPPVPPLLPPGRLGKIQLLKSGKARLITENGLRYDVWSGMDVAFAQYLAAVSLREDGTDGDGDGTLHVLSDITRKLVVTPKYLIGANAAAKGVSEAKISTMHEMHNRHPPGATVSSVGGLSALEPSTNSLEIASQGPADAASKAKQRTGVKLTIA